MNRAHFLPGQRRILVIRPDRIGDVVLATPLIRALRKSFPTAYIAAMVRPNVQEVLWNNPHLDEILLYDPDGIHAGWGGFWRMVRTLRSKAFDTALLLLPVERIAWMLFFAGVPRRMGVGFKLYEALTFMRTVSRRRYIPLRHEADYCLDLGRAIGVSPDGLKTEIFLTDLEREQGADYLRKRGASLSGVKVGIQVGSGGSSPNWEPQRYVELARQILEQLSDVTIILTGSSEEKDYGYLFSSLSKGRIVPAYVELAEPTDGRVRLLASIISQLDLLITPSTGPMHIAAALGVPTVSLFCPLPACSPILWGPQGNVSCVVMPPASYCLSKCPRDPKVCKFEAITVERVVQAVNELLELLKQSKDV